MHRSARVAAAVRAYWVQHGRTAGASFRGVVSGVREERRVYVWSAQTEGLDVSRGPKATLVNAVDLLAVRTRSFAWAYSGRLVSTSIGGTVGGRLEKLERSWEGHLGGGCA